MTIKRPEKLLWIDLEMTGLRPNRDRITEVAAIVTDFKLKEIASYSTGVKHPKNLLIELTKDSLWHTAQPSYTEAMIEHSLNGKTEVVVQAELLSFIEEHIGLSKKPQDFFYQEGSLESKGEVYLAGNSIATDRAFIDVWWPQVTRVLHYRMLDVSTFKIWHQANGGVTFRKKNRHKALDDIRESIEELKYYLKEPKSGL